MRTVHAGMSVFDLVQALRRAAWGPLAGARFRCPRTLLITLADLSKIQRTDLDGSMITTQSQLADYASYSQDWVSQGLRILEDLGIISYTRGRVFEGRPRPGRVTIIKRVLVEWIKAARAAHDEAVAARREATRRRITKANKCHLWPRKSKKPGVFGELAANIPGLAQALSFLRKEYAPPRSGRRMANPHQLEKEAEMYRKYLPPVCKHGLTPPTCRWCITVAKTAAKNASTPTVQQAQSALTTTFSQWELDQSERELSAMVAAERINAESDYYRAQVKREHPEYGPADIIKEAERRRAAQRTELKA